MLAAAVALSVAAMVNALIHVAGGARLEIPGELGLGQVVGFTLAPIPVVAVLLRLAGRWYPLAIVIGTAVTLPFPVAEFGSTVGAWLIAMHLVAGATALVAGLSLRRQG